MARSSGVVGQHKMNLMVFSRLLSHFVFFGLYFDLLIIVYLF